jgi:hypothetical protein
VRKRESGGRTRESAARRGESGARRGGSAGTRLLARSLRAPITAGEGQSANSVEGGSKTCGRHVVGIGAEAGKESTKRGHVGVEA